MPQYQTSDGEPVVEAQAFGFFVKPVARRKSKVYQWVINAILAAVAVPALVLRDGVIINVAVWTAIVASAVYVFWIVGYVRWALKTSNYRIGQARAEAVPGLVYCALTYSNGGFHFGFFALGLFLGAISTYALAPLLIHLSRPFDSIESRAERDAAAICFLALLPIIIGSTYGMSAFGNTRVDTFFGPGVMLSIAAIAAFFILRHKLIAHRS